MDLMVIEVLGVPQVPPHDRMVDQLKIHFLKRRNNGGDVLTVIYPTSTPGQAYVIFESAKVPGVLECAHTLDVNGTFYPIRVKKADLSEVDMQVETTLDLSLFPKQELVRELLESCDFTVTEDIPGRLQLRGSFLKLKLLRGQLVQLQQHKRRHRKPSSNLHNGSSLEELVHNNPESRFVSKSSSKNLDEIEAVDQHQLLASVTPSSYQASGSDDFQKSHHSHHSYYGERNASSPVDAVVQEYRRDEHFPNRLSFLADHALGNDPSGPSLLQHASSSNIDSASGGFSRSLHSTYYSSTGSTSHATDTMRHRTSHKDSDSAGSLRRHPSSWASSSHSSPSASAGGISQSHMETDLINFIQTQRQNDLKKIKKDYGTEMTVQGDAEIATVSFFGKNGEKAKACLLDLIEEISPSLRTQKIHLKNYNHAEQRQILERSQRYQGSGVMITVRDDVIKLVGSSKGSFEMMQMVLGDETDLRRGRAMERGSKGRRSSSLPRQYEMTHHSSKHNSEPQASAAIQYTPSRYQEKPEERKAPRIIQGPEWTRSNVEHHDLNLATRDQRGQPNRDIFSSPAKDSQKSRFHKRLSVKNDVLTILPQKVKDFYNQKQTQD